MDKGEKEINLLAEVENACLFNTLMGRKGGSCMILKQKSFLYQEMLSSLKQHFLLIKRFLNKEKTVMQNTIGVDVDDRSGSGEFIETVFEQENETSTEVRGRVQDEQSSNDIEPFLHEFSVYPQ